MIDQIQAKLAAHRDEAYAAFQGKLIPTMENERILGIRSPVLRRLSQSLTQEERTAFLAALPHSYYDEDMLHAVLLSQIRDAEYSLRALEAFLPYVDNWAVCDTLRLPWVKTQPELLLPRIPRWLAAERPYTVRFAILMLMTYFLDDQFSPEHPNILSRLRREEYYIKMMLAWYYATALAKQWDVIIPYLERSALPVWVHNKTIQKALESRRIRPEQKAYLRPLRIRLQQKHN